MTEDQIIVQAIAAGASVSITTEPDGSRVVRIDAPDQERIDSEARSRRAERNRRYYERSKTIKTSEQVLGRLNPSERVLKRLKTSESVLIQTPPSPPPSPSPLSPTPPIPAPTPAPTPLRNPTRATAAESIYAAYPRKVGKPLALRAIAKALVEPPLGTDAAAWPALLLEITVRYCAARQGEDPNFTPHPGTWFNQRRFEDDPATWKTELAAQPSRFGQPSESERRAAVLKETDRIRTLTAGPKPVPAADRVTVADFQSAKSILKERGNETSPAASNR